MKNKLIFIGAVIFSLSIKAQIYTPSGAIQGVSVNNNIGIGTQTPQAKLSVQAGPDGYPTPLKAISIWGPNSPANVNSAQDLSWDFASAGSSVIRSYRGSNFDTYLQFMTNSEYGGNAPQIRMHISQNGNIGIGNTNPAVKLDVVGTISSYEPLALGSTLNSSQLIGQRSGNVGENTIINRLWTYRDANSNNWYASRLHDGISIDNSFKTPNLDTKTWWERDPLDNIQSWGNNSETYLTINKGNIGLGTTNPSQKLDVLGNGMFQGAIISSIQDDAGGHIQLKNPSKGGNGIANTWMIYNMTGVYGNSLQFWAYDDLGCAGGMCNNRFTVMDNGNVGIGSTNPQNKLDVNGTIHSKEVKVDMLGWSDFVFKKEYNLPTLQEVEKHIAENGHLENIPNEEEVLKNGINLGEMNAKLLQKIEELTLYVIEQEKKNSKQSIEIDSLKKENQKFQAIFERLNKIENQLK